MDDLRLVTANLLSIRYLSVSDQRRYLKASGRMLAVGEPQQQVPRFTDPDYDHFYTKPQKRRGIGDLIKFSSRQNSPWIFQEPTSSQLIRASEPRGAQPNVLANALCPRKVDGESYWSVTADEEFLQRLKTQVDNLLYAQDHKLHRRDRRTLSVYFELFMVGKTAETARMAVVITCLQSEDQDRVRKLIRKYPHVPEYDNVELKVMLGSPRSSKPLIKLASGESDDDDGDGWGTFSRTRQRRQVPSNEVTVGTSVYGVTDHHGSLLIPATIFIGEKKDGQHKATLGGLVSLVRSRQKLGFTIAHTSSDQDKTEKTTEASEESNRTCIGTISRKSREDSADWALIKFHVGIHPRTSLLPPETISIIGDESTAIRVLSTRGSLKGTLSGSVTWINIDGSPSSTKAWPISLDNSIRQCHISRHKHIASVLTKLKGEVIVDPGL